MKSKGLFQPLVLGTVLAFGFLVVWMFVALVALENRRTIAIKNGVVEDALSIRADGTALIAHHEAGVVSHRDLNGVPIAIPENDPTGKLNGAPLPSALPFRRQDSEWDNRVRFFTDGRTPHTAWYFIADGRPDGTAYFIGYDSYSKAKIGYLGTSGFRAEMPPPEERFPFAGATSGRRLQAICPGQEGRPRRTSASREGFGINGQDTVSPCLVYLLGLDSKIYEADLRKRRVRIAVHERDIRSFTILDFRKSSPTEIAWRLAVRTDKNVLVVDKHGTEQQRYPIPQELVEKPIMFGETTAGDSVMYWNKECDVLATENKYCLFWVRPDGRSRTASLTLPQSPFFQELRFHVAALLPSPLALAVVGVIRSRELQESIEPTFSSAVLRTVKEFWPSLALAQLLALGLAVLCYRRQVRFGASRAERMVWPLFVLLLGLPGWIGYRFGRSWPVLESCPECGVSVPRDRESCLRCTNDFPRPALKETEVFA